MFGMWGLCRQVHKGQVSQWMVNRLAVYKSDITKQRDRCSLTEHMDIILSGIMWKFRIKKVIQTRD